MSKIAAAVFADQASADDAMDALSGLGVGPPDVETFVLNGPGRHGQLPMGGDEDADSDARQGDRGALRGAAVGSAVGVVAGAPSIPVIGPMGLAGGLAAGAYAGALAGALSSMGERRNEPSLRPSGVMVAVNLDHARSDDKVLDAMYDSGAQMIERAQGEWTDGHWSDFDPVAHPQHVEFEEPRPGSR
ncbi:MAG TPA: hypothetical protein VIL19_09965 [Casimicrobiaceae bacterium]